MRSHRRAAVIIVMATLVAVLACGQAGARGKRLSAAEYQLVKLVNCTRAEHGRAPLKISYALSRAAERHSVDMVRHGDFSHSSLCGQSPGARMQLSGYRTVGAHSGQVGEVIGWGAGSFGSPEIMLRRWLTSSAHRAIVLSRRWQHIGVGRVVGRFQGVSGAAVFTVDFGCRK